ncbi:MAG: hypothetical protein ACE5JL_19800 [Dehalococcoidia bacterium]
MLRFYSWRRGRLWRRPCHACHQIHDKREDAVEEGGQSTDEFLALGSAVDLAQGEYRDDKSGPLCWPYVGSVDQVSPILSSALAVSILSR